MKTILLALLLVSCTRHYTVHPYAPVMCQKHAAHLSQHSRLIQQASEDSHEIVEKTVDEWMCLDEPTKKPK